MVPPAPDGESKKTHLDAEARGWRAAARRAWKPARFPRRARRNPRRRGFVRERRDIGRRERHARSSAGSCAGSTAGRWRGRREAAAAEKEKTPRETRKRVRWSEGVEANDFFTKKKKRGGRGVSAANVARDDDDSFAPAAGTDAVAASKASERAARYARRSSFAAAAAAPETDKIDDETWASLPRGARRDFAFSAGDAGGALGARGSSKARRIHDPTTGESPGGVAFDAFGAHLGVRAARFVPGEAKRPAGPAGRRGRRRRPRRGARGKGRTPAPTPATTACPRPSRRSTPRSSRRSARRRHARCARTTSAPPGRRSCARAASGRAHALEGWQERRRRRTKTRRRLAKATGSAAANARRRRG